MINFRVLRRLQVAGAFIFFALSIAFSPFRGTVTVIHNMGVPPHLVAFAMLISGLIVLLGIPRKARLNGLVITPLLFYTGASYFFIVENDLTLTGLIGYAYISVDMLIIVMRDFWRDLNVRR